MDKRALYKVVAEAIRIEYEEKSDTVYLVFEITDNDFKNKIKKDWAADIELELEDKKLIISKD